jgi:hypothetical protein
VAKVDSLWEAKCLLHLPPLTGKLLERVNVTNREDLNWGWKSHTEMVSKFTASRVTQNFCARDLTLRPLLKILKKNTLRRVDFNFSKHSLSKKS